MIGFIGIYIYIFNPVVTKGAEVGPLSTEEYFHPGVKTWITEVQDYGVHTSLFETKNTQVSPGTKGY